MEKQGDSRVLVAVLFTILLLGIIGLFMAREHLKTDSNKSDSRSASSQTNLGRPDLSKPYYGEARSTGLIPNLSSTKPTDFAPFMANMQRRIKRSWFPPKNTESLRGKVLFKVHSDGTLSNLRMQKGTGVALADEAMLQAVDRAAPFNALPLGAPSDVDIEFTFDYNVFAHDAKLPASDEAESKSKSKVIPAN